MQTAKAFALQIFLVHLLPLTLLANSLLGDCPSIGSCNVGG